jgi:hypothetical protein
MSPHAAPKQYRVWAMDDVVYGPVTPDVLRDWVRDERILPDTWIFCESTRQWNAAREVTELRVLFGLEDNTNRGEEAQAIRPAVLRRIRAFGELTDDDLSAIGRLGELVQIGAFQTLMRAGTPSDAVYFVIEGQVRQRIMVRGREILIAVKESGTAFGYISLFDGGNHITDAVSDSPVILFRIPLDRFHHFCKTRPDIGVNILFSLGRTLATRVRSDDRHLCELVALNQSGR